MIGYLCCGCWSLYYTTFCGMFCYTLCKEEYERRQQIINEYNRIPEMQHPQLETILESELEYSIESSIGNSKEYPMRTLYNTRNLA